MPHQKIPVIIIGGPTASGKSAFALDLAHQNDGEIINADSMQVYSHLQILTARPTLEECGSIPHHLYGVLQGDEIGSVAWWYDQACDIIQDVHQRGKMPIIVGGTGLYLRTLTQGLSAIPTIPHDIRSFVHETARSLPKEEFYTFVLKRDPLIEGNLRQNDTQRLSRALEVVLATKTSIRQFQGKDVLKLPLEAKSYVLSPPRDRLYDQINQRFKLMIDQGATQEVERLLKMSLPSHCPILKAVGVPEISRYLQNEITLDEAISLAQQSTRRYAKRQMTWFRNQMAEAEWVDMTGNRH